MDIAEPAVIFALQAAGLNVVDGQQLMLNTRKVKTEDEISLLNMACSMVDATYDELYRALRPGVRENEAVAMANKTLYEMGSEHVEGINAISGERCNPHPHNFTDRILRPGDPAYFDIMHSYMGYRTCYYRTLAIGSASPSQRDAYKKCAGDTGPVHRYDKAGSYHGGCGRPLAPGPRVRVPQRGGGLSRLQYGHGVGLSIWEKPIFSRYISLDAPETIEEGMTFALETFWPATDGWSAARIEEQLVVTADGCEVITKFPAEELLVCGVRYYTGTGPLPTTREAQSHLNRGE